MNSAISAERVRHLLSYEADTGVFRWRVREHSGGRTTYVGSYQSHSEAYEAYKAAKRNAHPGCTI